MAIEIAISLPQFGDDYDGLKMRAFVEEVERLHAALTADIDDAGSPGPVYTITNVTPDRAYDADTVLIPELADVVGTLISDLQNKNIIG